MVIIRLAKAEDYDQIVASLNDWWGGRQMSTMLPRLFFQHFGPWALAADRNGGLVGFLAGLRSETNPTQVYCHFIGVDPRARGHGIGEALYRRLFVDAVAAGCTEALAVTAPQNRASIAFHRRLGFEILPGDRLAGDVPYTPNYDGPGEDRVKFRLDLTAAAGTPCARAD